jgi:electron transfer flavoprotein alpha subunit
MSSSSVLGRTLRRLSARPAVATRRWATTFVLSEPLANNAIPPATLAAVTAAQQLSPDNSITLLIGAASADAPTPTTIPQGVQSVQRLVPNTTTAADALTPEVLADMVVQTIKQQTDTSLLVGTSTKFGSTVVPRIAALLQTSPVTDVVAISGETLVRPMYAGNALAHVKRVATNTTQVVTIRPTSFEKAPCLDGDASAITTVTMDTTASAALSEWVSASGAGGGEENRPDLGSAAVVVSGGRGMQNGDNFILLQQLADALGGGAVGASRAAVDAGMAPNDWQVGQTGKVVAPNLYVAVGISGAIQHLSGMKDSKTIVAINKDGDAPIFQVADYGLVADLFEAVPEMTKKLQK